MHRFRCDSSLNFVFSLILYYYKNNFFQLIMAMAGRVARGTRLPPEVCLNTFFQLMVLQVNRILFVKNLPYKITSEEMYEIFGKFGALRQVRM